MTSIPPDSSTGQEQDTFYSNPPIPEGINATDHHPLRSFLIYTSSIVGTFIVLVLLVGFIASLLAPYIPFSWERALFPNDPAKSLSNTDAAISNELQQLAAKISTAMALEQDIVIDIHYIDSDVINAFATVGGHIFVYRGILATLDSEDALAALLAHEMAHIAHRDVMQRLLRGAGVFLILAGIDSVSPILGVSAEMSSLTYSRSQEEAADLAATSAVARLYGHTRGAVSLFEKLEDALDVSAKIQLPEIFSSHPNFPSRIARIRAQTWPSDGKLTPLPPAIAQIKP